jgi:hypothetical protein
MCGNERTSGDRVRMAGRNSTGTQRPSRLKPLCAEDAFRGLKAPATSVQRVVLHQERVTVRVWKPVPGGK